MSSRRQPLLSNPNAVNSPCRPSANTLSKQKRSHANIQREDAYGQPPPTKKQMLDSRQALRTPPRQHSARPQVEGRVYTRRANASQNPNLERRAVAVRERNTQHTNNKADKTEDENLETIRAWQKHYRKVFPTFVFYFESIPEDTRLKYTKQVTALGAREEKFFSNAVTHVVTTRSIPTEQVSPVEVASSTTNESNSQNSQLQTINPSLLDRSSESTHIQSDSFTTKGKFYFEPQINRRLGSQTNDAEIRRQQVRNADVLHRARELNMKIWALEKLQRMMTTMFDTETGYQVSHGHNTRGNSVQGTASIPRATADLSQLLRNEKLNGPSDRDLTVASKELCIFKGPYIYIHDIDEKQRPIMVREYAKVTHKEDGEWPQFRSVTGGKCPFVDEPDHTRRDHEKEQLRLQRQQERERTMASRTRAATADAAKMQPPRSVQAKPVLGELDVGSTRNVTVSTKQSNPFAPNKPSLPRGTDVEASSRGNAFVSRARGGRLLGGEPVASGLQASNVTSAIRSQMISSTSAQPGARAGTSKEVHGLQRKVLEKNSGGPGSYGLTSSHRMTDITAAAREDAHYQQTRRKEKLGLIREDSYQSEAEMNARKIEEARKAKAVQQRKSEKRDPKPGYCENCQDKFDDFDEHILSRKHRKFAEKADNWKELDALLNKLARPEKERDEYSDEF